MFPFKPGMGGLSLRQQTGLSTSQGYASPTRKDRTPAQSGTSPKQDCLLSVWKRPQSRDLSASWRGKSCPIQQGLPLQGPHPPQTKSLSDLLPFPLLATSLGFQSSQLAGDSPTNGKSRAINMGLPLVETATVFLLPGRWMPVPGKANGFSS